MSATTPPAALDGRAPTPPPAPARLDLEAVLAPAERPHGASALGACLAFAWRAMRRIRHVPEQLLDVTITPVLFLVMFVYLFGGAMAGSTDAYLQFVLPGVVVQSVLFTTVYSGVTLATDMSKGVVDRFRTLPVWAPAPLVGAAVGDLARYLVAATVTVVLGLALGYDADGGVLGVLGALALVALLAFGLAWVFALLGIVLRSPNAVMNGGFMVMFPLVFLSNVFVDPATLPAVLEWFVGVNPVSHVATAVRGLMGGGADAGDVALVLAEAAALTAVFVPLTSRAYRSRA
ncbi:ABC transporter permease [Patulibacter sp. SYSU D01012]|uniref:ABC transporter permease n=1 Tax=Patulibacter sp. SYSU D01012 TaxID=2817381 RepID=UPI001B315ABF|nr:ABC transporter permease [Patulibacter sp. SYSU D01012]